MVVAGGELSDATALQHAAENSDDSVAREIGRPAERSRFWVTRQRGKGSESDNPVGRAQVSVMFMPTRGRTLGVQAHMSGHLNRDFKMEIRFELSGRG